MDDLIDRQAAIDCEYQVKIINDIEYVMLSEVQMKMRKLPSAQPEQRWIPCSERLPEESGRYLVSVLDGVGRRTTVAPYQPRYKAWTMTGRMAYWKVIAWMPLPAQYIPEGDDKHEG